MRSQFKEKKIKLGSMNINYVEMPSKGVPLLLLHGGGQASWRSFEGIIPDLAKSYHVYAPDFRGHGNSGWMTGNYKLRDFCDDIVQFLRDVVGSPAYMFGHSLGGKVAMMVAAQYHEGVKALAVGDSPLSTKRYGSAVLKSNADLKRLRGLAGGQVSIDEIIENLKNHLLLAPGSRKKIKEREVYGENYPGFKYMARNLYLLDPDVLTSIMYRYKSYTAGSDPKDLLPKIKCAMLLLQADPKCGGMMTDSDVKGAVRLGGNVSHIKLNGVSHVLHNEKPEMVLNVLRSFFNSYKKN